MPDPVRSRRVTDQEGDDPSRLVVHREEGERPFDRQTWLW